MKKPKTEKPTTSWAAWPLEAMAKWLEAGVDLQKQWAAGNDKVAERMADRVRRTVKKLDKQTKRAKRSTKARDKKERERIKKKAARK